MWESILLLLLAGGASSVWAAIAYQRGRLLLWKSIASLCHLQVEELSFATEFLVRMQARSGPLKIRIFPGQKRNTSQIVITIPGPRGFPGVRIRCEESVLLKTREIETGDESFDGRFFIEGPMRLVTVLLDAEMRKLLLRLSTEGMLELSRGELRVEAADDDLTRVMPLLLDIGRRLCGPVAVAQRLAENAGRDPNAAVRLRNLILLIREHPGEPGTVEALRVACKDPSPQIRLRAARELRGEGLGILLELVESEEDAVSAEAILALGRELPFERTQALLDQALRRRRLQTAGSCLEALGRSGEPAAVDVLARVLAREKGELAAAAALALGTTGSAGAEPPLILALQRETARLRVAATNALARVGTVAAVLALKDAAGRFPSDPQLQQATRQAIAEIQSRLPGASPGQLSLAEAEVGQLSLAQAEAGQLSLAIDPPLPEPEKVVRPVDSALLRSTIE
jgi:hypothetical protein